MAKSLALVGSALEQLSPKQILEMDPKEVRDTFTEAEGRLFTKIRNAYVGRITADLTWCHQLGADLRKALEEKQKQSPSGKRPWRQHLVERIARGLGLRSPEQLYQAIEVNAAWPDKAKFVKEIVNRIGPKHNRLTWSHAATLARIESYDKRTKAVEEVLEKNMTVRETFRLVQDKEPSKRAKSDKSGTFKRPASLMQAVAQIVRESKAITRRCNEAWLKEPTLVDLATELAPFQITAELKHGIDQAYDAMSELTKAMLLMEAAFDEVKVLIQRRTGAIDSTAQVTKAEPSPDSCPRGGQHEDVVDENDGTTVCRKCHDPFPHVAEKPKVKGKGTSPPSTKNKSRKRLRPRDAS